MQYTLPSNEFRGTIQVTDSKGSVYDKITLYENSGTEILSVENYPNGVYFIQLETESGFKSQKKLLRID